MSKYDKEREKLGVRAVGGQSSSVNPNSKYARDREALYNPQPVTSQEPAIKPSAPLVDSGMLPALDFRKSGIVQEASRMPVQAKEQPERPGRDIPVIGHVLRTLDAVADNPIVKTVGDIGRAVYTPGAGLANTAGLYKAAETALGRVAPGLGATLGGRVAQEAIKEGVTGVPLAMGNALTSQTSDLGEAAQMGLIGGAIGAVGGGALAAAGGAFARSKLGQMFSDWMSQRNTPEPQPAPEVLALPEPRQRGNLNQVQTPDVINVPETAPRGLPEPKVAPPTRARSEVRTNPYTAKLEKLFETAKQQELPPGREREYLEDLWSRMAEPTDPGLDELIDLAYPSRPNRVTPDLVNRARTYQAAREVAGAPMPVKSMADRYQGGVVNPAAAPATRVARGTDIPSQQPNVEITAPKRNFAPVSQVVKNSPPAQSKYAAERGFATTIKASEKVPEGVKSQIQSAYTPITNAETIAKANKRIGKDIEEAANYVMGQSRLSADKVAVGMRLIDEFTKQGNHARAVSIVEKLAPELTRAGQSIQAVSMYERLSPNGVLLYAQRIADKVNEKLPVTSKAVQVTPEMSADLTTLAQTTQKMTGVKEMSNNVLDILERAKAGENLTEAEQQTIKQFVSEARAFVKETTRKPSVRPPKPPQDKRIRDNVTTFLDAQEQAAKERLRARGIRLSSTPLDVYADYAIIGAAKMAKGTIKFADWSEQMVKELGESVRPYLEQIYERSVQAFDQSAKQVSETTISQAEKIAERMIKGKQIEGEQADFIRELAQKVSRLSGDAKNVASQDLQAVLMQLERSSFLQKVSMSQTIAQLLNPKTLLTRNPLGNEMFYRLERLNKWVTTPIDIARSKITGGQRTVTFRTNNQGEYWRNFIKGAVAGWKGVNPDGLATQFDIRPNTFNGKWNPMRYLEKSLGASLKAFDYAAYKRAVNETVGELATLRAINEGKGRDKALIEKYIREADENILAIADEYGRYITFQDNNLISQGLVALKRGLNFKKDFGVGDLVLKYPKTPGALLMRAIEYSPAGILRSAYIAAKPYLQRGSEPNTREAMHALSRAITGTAGLTGLGYFFAETGIITGAASKDRDVRELQKLAGQGQYQVNLTALKRWIQSGFKSSAAKLQEGDTFYTYDWAQPVAIALSVGANINQGIKDKETTGKVALGVLGTGYESMAGAVNTLTEQSVLKGLKQAAEGYPGQTVMDKITSVLSDVPASFVPTAFNQANQLMDNARRETYDPSPVQQSLNRLKVKIPGLAQQLPQQFDTLGRPKEAYQNGGNNLFNVLLNPGYTGQYKLTPEAKLVVNLINDTGDASVAPRAPGKSINVRLPGGKSESMKLTPEQYSRMQQLTGEETQKRLERINPNLPNDTKLRAITKALNDAGEKARVELKREMGVR